MSELSALQSKVQALTYAVATVGAALAAVVFLSVVFKWVIYARIAKLLDRVESLLALNERHGVLNDEKVNSMNAKTANAAKGIIAAVNRTAAEVKESVPAKVVERVAQVSTTPPPLPQSSEGSIPVVPATP